MKNPPANVGRSRDVGSVPGSGVGNGYPLQCSCLENSMDSGAWWVIVHGITKSCTCLSVNTHTYRGIKVHGISVIS